MAKKYVYIDGVKYEVVNNYILGLDVYGDDSVPTPSVADSGKVLGVDEEGKYALIEAGGGGGTEIVNATPDNDGLSLDKTYNEIKTAFLNGNVVISYYNTYGIVYGISDKDDGEETPNIVSVYIPRYNDTPLRFEFLTIDADGYPVYQGLG